MNKYKISIITPVFNGQRFIELCLLNVIEQKCPDAEHIIVDGGSTDDSIGVIKKYAERYSHIRWISEKDKGQSDAMNKGIAMAKGGIVGILNADDYYESNVLHRVIEIFKTLPDPGFAAANCNVWDDAGILQFVNKPSHIKFSDLLIGDESIHPFPMNSSAYFYHKSLHDVIGLYNEEEHFVLDTDFILRAVQHASIKYVDETWGNYRFISGTKTYNDIVDGKIDKRFQDILHRYRKRLSFSARLKIAAVSQTYTSLRAVKYQFKKMLQYKWLE
jgi:glycosyltransferase involved in cell wall biosynthesis